MLGITYIIGTIAYLFIAYSGAYSNSKNKDRFGEPNAFQEALDDRRLLREWVKLGSDFSVSNLLDSLVLSISVVSPYRQVCLCIMKR